MSELRFRDADGNEVPPHEWLRIWSAEYPSRYVSEHDRLISKFESFASVDFERIGKWKDDATTPARWKPNVASVAYQIWMQAAQEMPTCPDESGVSLFLDDWSERKYTDTFKAKSVQKRFGLARATTLLYFVSRGRFPIFDSFVRKAVKSQFNLSLPNSVRCYVESYCPLVLKIARVTGAAGVREVEKALFSFRE